MKKNVTEKENSSDYQLFSTLESFDTIIDDNNNSLLDQINSTIDDEKIDSDSSFYDYKEKKSSFNSNKSKLFSFFKKIWDSSFLLLLIIDSSFRILTTMFIILDYLVSFYCIIIINYVFFVSSIFSYIMAPIYQSSSGDWLNFCFSFAQVILASPLIAFYIYYIIKSVKTLGNYLFKITHIFKKILSTFTYSSRYYFVKFMSTVMNANYKLLFNFKQTMNLLLNILKYFILYVFFIFVGYISLKVDKAIIMAGIPVYIINTAQIILLIIPSYLYFFKTIFNIKCKKNKFVEKYINKSKSIINSNKENSSEQKVNKIIDDDDIGLFIDYDYETLEKPNSVINNIKKVFADFILADNYFSLYSYSKYIAIDRHKQTRKRIVFVIFFILNLVVISYDIYQLKNDYSGYFLASIIIRFLMIPLFSFYNIFTISFHQPKNTLLYKIIKASTIFTIIIIAIIIGIFIFVFKYQLKYRIKNLEYFPINNNITIANEDLINHPICEYKTYNVSAFDAFGYALGGYDIKRNKTIFDNQMKTFFDANFSDHISYTIYELDDFFYFLKYYDSSIDTYVFAFKGYNSRPELAFQIELFVGFYIIPFFEDNVPFYGFLNEFWLSFYTNFFNSFGLRFFENQNLIVKYVKSIMNIYYKENLNDERILFTGINCGGVIAKIVGTLLHQKSISFLSFPIDIDFIQNLFDFSSYYIGYITNIYNVDGFFSHSDSDYANNIGFSTPVFKKSKDCTSKFCDLESRLDNVYESFCAMSEICGKGNQFNYYCENIIGKKYLDIIRENIQ